MNDTLSKATVIAGIAATSDLDAQSERLSIEGADIGEMVRRGVFNDNHSQGGINTIGKITEAKKILKPEDAIDSIQKDFWERVKKPFIFVKGYLFDSPDSNHPNAKSWGAIMREFRKYGDGKKPLEVQMSVEGKVIDKEPSGYIKRSLVRNIALTLVPANDATGTQIVSDEMQTSILAKCKQIGGDVNYANSLIKNINGHTSLPIKGFVELIDSEEQRLLNVYNRLNQVNGLVKMLSVGYGSSGSPASRTDGSTITKESSDKKVKRVTFPISKPSKKREKKEKVLKSLIKKVREGYPDLPYEQVVELAFEVYRKKVK